jgi:hypothetical protein
MRLSSIVGAIVGADAGERSGASAETDETPVNSREHTAAGSKNREILLLLFCIRAKLLFRDILLLV